jgi:fatty-acyl-CoA synthase
MVALSRAVPRKHAMEMLLTGDMIRRPRRAHRAGQPPSRPRRWGGHDGTGAQDRRAKSACLQTTTRCPQPGEPPAADAAAVLERAATVFPDHIAIVHGGLRRSYAANCASRAAARPMRWRGGHRARRHGGGAAAQHARDAGMPLRRADGGGVLNTINTRLDAATIAYILDHGEAKVVIVDREVGAAAAAALAQCNGEAAGDRGGRPEARRPRRQPPGRRRTTRPSSPQGDPAFAWLMPGDEWDAIALNYTSGTTGGRRAWSITTAARICWRSATCCRAGMGKHPVYLWTLPMFHCNGWCFPWTLSPRIAGTHVCLRGARRSRHVAADGRPRA